MAKLLAVVAVLVLLSPQFASSTPQFARKYKVGCAMCHSAVPRLNQTGEDFLARGYKLAPDSQLRTHRTIPAAVWATARGQFDLFRDRARGLPNRVEIISAGPVAETRAFYFVEWLPLSQEVGANNQRVARHGRFEDLFVSVPVRRIYLTIGHFRALSQIDVSRRLSLSEPLAFSAGIGGRAASTARLTGLRSFSLSGRSPGFRVSHHWNRGPRAADGWYNAVTVPLGGELVIPLTERVRRERNFEFELRPKGVLLESFYKIGLGSIGGHAFLGDERNLIGAIGSYHFKKLYSTAAIGRARERSGATDVRFSWENEFIPTKYAALGFRIDDRSGPNRPAAYSPYANLYFPVTSHTFRMTAEYREQRNARQWLLEAGIVF